MYFVSLQTRNQAFFNLLGGQFRFRTVQKLPCELIIKALTLTGQVQSIRPWDKHFACITSLTFHNTPTKVFFVVVILTKGKTETRGDYVNVPEVTRPVDGGAV